MNLVLVVGAYLMMCCLAVFTTQQLFRLRHKPPLTLSEIVLVFLFWPIIYVCAFALGAYEGARGLIKDLRR